ncbi:F-box/kelch-repeat protein [Ananas comosus]|uniref:F-box/kelch-repeat protein n=1 Tax=Ananas comosus TaxID=4615 RepID=A0A199W0G9_ANACO|nr:F-box/kelch-repeat protein [Ananas comosus]
MINQQTGHVSSYIVLLRGVLRGAHLLEFHWPSSGSPKGHLRPVWAPTSGATEILMRERERAESERGRGELRVSLGFSVFPEIGCLVDAGLKTVAGAKKYVPGSKLCVQPNLRASIHPSRPKSQRSDRSRSQSPLLPGLPDDLAIACLIRVPRADHCKLRLVCRRWCRLLAGNYFYALRRTLGIAEEWVYVIKRDKDGRISWDAFDPVYQLWHPLPPLPAEYSGALGGSMRRVIFYSARTNKWHRAPDMLRRRHFFGSCVMNNCLYVAGGESEGGHRSLKSAEVYDPIKNRWSFVSDMSTAMVPFIGVVYEGKWYLKGLGDQRQVLNEVYEPETDSWCSWVEKPKSVFERPALHSGLIYDARSHSWSEFIDSKQHLGSSRALEAAALVPFRGKLCIIAQGEGNGGQIKTFVTNLWSNIAERNRPKILLWSSLLRRVVWIGGSQLTSSRSSPETRQDMW